MSDDFYIISYINADGTECREDYNNKVYSNHIPRIGEHVHPMMETIGRAVVTEIQHALYPSRHAEGIQVSRVIVFAKEVK